MPAIGSKNTLGEWSIGEAFAVGISKSLGEVLIGRTFIGNGTITSGLVKMAGAYAIPKMLLKNKFGRIIGTGLAVDGVEDVLRSFLGGSSNGGSATI